MNLIYNQYKFSPYRGLTISYINLTQKARINSKLDGVAPPPTIFTTPPPKKKRGKKASVNVLNLLYKKRTDIKNQKNQ